MTPSEKYQQLIKRVEENYFSAISMSILFASAWGGIAAMKIHEHHSPAWQLVLSIFVAMLNLVSILGQMPAKWVVNFFTLSVIVNGLLILMNLF